jgi:hypothetical protein
VGLYWGEGNKANKHTIRIGNSDARLLEVFIKFLKKFYGIPRTALKAHIHLFTDIDIKAVYVYWMKALQLKKDQFYKPTITISGKLGTYSKKSEYGVLTLYYGNVKLRNIIVGLIDTAGNLLHKMPS